jgi:serine/threonine protein kinase
MFVKLCCPHPDCRQHYRVKEDLLGKKTVCKRCGRTILLQRPALETAPESQQVVPSEDAPAIDLPAAAHSGQPDAPSPGSDLQTLGRFRIISRLGRGAFGTVYRAYDPVLDREVALKVPHAEALDRPEAKARFLREPKAAAQLRHPHIVPIYDAGIDGDRLYIASAYIDGQTLEAAIDAERPDFRQAAVIVHDLADALYYAHLLGVIHRDVKPANIMIDDRGEALLMDFGLARLDRGEEKLTQDGTLMGTPAYMPPEQVDGRLGEVGPAGDQYSLGVVLYELLCGETPFSGPPSVVLFNVVQHEPPPPRSKNPTVPKDLETICLKAMSKQPSQRYADCQELTEDLRRWLADEPIHARQLGSVERIRRWARRNPFLSVLSLAVILLAILSTVVAAGLFQSRRDLSQALSVASEQTRRAEEQADRADKQTILYQEQARIAKDKARLAEDNENKAKDSLDKLQRAVAAQNKAEAEKKAEEEGRKQLASKLQEQKTKAAENENSWKKSLDEAVEKSSWLQYTENLSAADKAYQNHHKDKTIDYLSRCPQEHRAWEWNYLHSLAKGLRPVEELSNDIPFNSSGSIDQHITISPNAQWIATDLFPDNNNVYSNRITIYKLPHLDPLHYLHSLPPNKSLVFLSNDGNFLIISWHKHFPYAEGFVYEYYNTENGKQLFKGNYIAYDPICCIIPCANKITLLRLNNKWNYSFYSSETGFPITSLKQKLNILYDTISFSQNNNLVIASSVSKKLTLKIFEYNKENNYQVEPISWTVELPREVHSPRPFFPINGNYLFIQEGTYKSSDGSSSEGAQFICKYNPPQFMYEMKNPNTIINRHASIISTPDGKRILMHKNGKPRLIDIETQEELPELKCMTFCNKFCSDIFLSPDWKRVIGIKIDRKEHYPDKSFKFYRWSINKQIETSTKDSEQEMTK